MNFSLLKFLPLFFGAMLCTYCSDNNLGLSQGEASEPPSGEIKWQIFAAGDTVDIYLRNEGAVFCGNSASQAGLIEEADTSSFEVWPGSSYARDSAFVYYPIESKCIPTDSTELCFCSEYIVEGATPFSFHYIGNGYATDGKDLYQYGVLVQGNNGETF